MSLLDGEGSELRPVLLDDLLKASERLNFVEQGRIASWEGQKLNCNAIAVSPEGSAVEGRWRSHEVSGASVGTGDGTGVHAGG
jgi:hypothetical protein